MLTTLDRQVLIDLCIESTGDLERLFDTAIANGQSITWQPAPGTVVATGAPEARRRNLLQVFADRSNAPASADQDAALEFPGGIGFMEVGFDFRVS